MVKARDVWPCGAFLAEGHLNWRNFSAMLRQISLLPAQASWCSETTRLGAVLQQRFHPLVPGDGGSASRAARQQYSRHDGFARYAAKDRLLTEPIQPRRALQGRKISLYLCNWIEYDVREPGQFKEDRR